MSEVPANRQISPQTLVRDASIVLEDPPVAVAASSSSSRSKEVVVLEEPVVASMPSGEVKLHLQPQNRGLGVTHATEVRIPASEAKAKPASEAKAKPASEAKAKPASKAKAKPASEAKAKPASEAKAKPAKPPASNDEDETGSKWQIDPTHVEPFQ